MLKSRKPTALRAMIEHLLDELIHAEFEAECQRTKISMPVVKVMSKEEANRISDNLPNTQE